jgi:hypothetical protein
MKMTKAPRRAGTKNDETPVTKFDVSGYGALLCYLVLVWLSHRRTWIFTGGRRDRGEGGNVNGLRIENEKSKIWN